MNLFCSTFGFYYLCGAITAHVAVIKRESGVSPGQSRCCDPHLSGLFT